MILLVHDNKKEAHATFDIKNKSEKKNRGDMLSKLRQSPELYIGIYIHCR